MPSDPLERGDGERDVQQVRLVRARAYGGLLDREHLGRLVDALEQADDLRERHALERHLHLRLAILRAGRRGARLHRVDLHGRLRGHLLERGEDLALRAALDARLYVAESSVHLVVTRAEGAHHLDLLFGRGGALRRVARGRQQRHHEPEPEQRHEQQAARDAHEQPLVRGQALEGRGHAAPQLLHDASSSSERLMRTLKFWPPRRASAVMSPTAISAKGPHCASRLRSWSTLPKLGECPLIWITWRSIESSSNTTSSPAGTRREISVRMSSADRLPR